MYYPKQFNVNEAWIVVRVNEAFLLVQDEPHDMFALVDAASAYVFGFVLSKVVDEVPNQEQVEDLFKNAWKAKRQWAEKLIMVEDFSANDVFIKQAEQNGLECVMVPASDIEPIVGPLKELFEKDFFGKLESARS